MTGIYDTTNDTCNSHANLKGEDIPCQLATDHMGWAHQNLDHEMLWQGAVSDAV